MWPGTEGSARHRCSRSAGIGNTYGTVARALSDTGRRKTELD